MVEQMQLTINQARAQLNDQRNIIADKMRLAQESQAAIAQQRQEMFTQQNLRNLNINTKRVRDQNLKIIDTNIGQVEAYKKDLSNANKELDTYESNIIIPAEKEISAVNEAEQWYNKGMKEPIAYLSPEAKKYAKDILSQYNYQVKHQQLPFIEIPGYQGYSTPEGIILKPLPNTNISNRIPEIPGYQGYSTPEGIIFKKAPLDLSSIKPKIDLPQNIKTNLNTMQTIQNIRPPTPEIKTNYIPPLYPSNINVKQTIQNIQPQVPTYQELPKNIPPNVIQSVQGKVRKTIPEILFPNEPNPERQKALAAGLGIAATAGTAGLSQLGFITSAPVTVLRFGEKTLNAGQGLLYLTSSLPATSVISQRAFEYGQEKQFAGKNQAEQLAGSLIKSGSEFIPKTPGELAKTYLFFKGYEKIPEVSKKVFETGFALKSGYDVLTGDVNQRSSGLLTIGLLAGGRTYQYLSQPEIGFIKSYPKGLSTRQIQELYKRGEFSPGQDPYVTTRYKNILGIKPTFQGSKISEANINKIIEQLQSQGMTKLQATKFVNSYEAPAFVSQDIYAKGNILGLSEIKSTARTMQKGFVIGDIEKPRLDKNIISNKGSVIFETMARKEVISPENIIGYKEGKVPYGLKTMRPLDLTEKKIIESSIEKYPGFILKEGFEISKSGKPVSRYYKVDSLTIKEGTPVFEEITLQYKRTSKQGQVKEIVTRSTSKINDQSKILRSNEKGVGYPLEFPGSSATRVVDTKYFNIKGNKYSLNANENILRERAFNRLSDIMTGKEITMIETRPFSELKSVEIINKKANIFSPVKNLKFNIKANSVIEKVDTIKIPVAEPGTQDMYGEFITKNIPVKKYKKLDTTLWKDEYQKIKDTIDNKQLTSVKTTTDIKSPQVPPAQIIKPSSSIRSLNIVKTSGKSISGSFTKVFPKEKQNEKIIEQTKVDVLTRQDTQQKTVQETRQVEDIIQAPVNINKNIDIQKISPSIKTATGVVQLPVQIITPVVTTKPITVPGIRQNINMPLSRTPNKIIKPVNFARAQQLIEIKNNKSVSKRKAYNVLVKRKGKFFEIAKGLPKGKALKAGAEKAIRTLARTFKLKESGSTEDIDISYFPSNKIFRAPKKPSDSPLTFVQRVALSRGTGEVREIQSIRKIKQPKKINYKTKKGRLYFK